MTLAAMLSTRGQVDSMQVLSFNSTTRAKGHAYMNYNIARIIEEARNKDNGVPYKKGVCSVTEGKTLAKLIETHLISEGYTFHTIKDDVENNEYIRLSRQGVKPLVRGARIKKVHYTIRVYETRLHSVHVDITRQV